MALRFYNTLTQQVEPFAPLHGNTVRMYTCGPTVYHYAHIGNFRTFTFEDILRRWLRARGYKLDHVMNITDVEDKIIRNAAAEHKSLPEYTEQYTQAFLEDSAALRLERPERMVKATEHITDMVLDIHAGGIDLIFPHHENEIAQSEAITSKPFARFWLHSEFLNVEMHKMSKSAGNFYTLRDLLGMGYTPESVRYLLASVPYRKKLNFTFDGLKAMATTIERLNNFKLRIM